MKGLVQQMANVIQFEDIEIKYRIAELFCVCVCGSKVCN